jgi:PTS system mannose-specific IIB component/fructoselysine and glucoselysine-specific PTS system IIB component
MIKVLRVDDRMLHGQVAVAWTNFFKVDTILIANDKLITDEAMKIAFKLAAPPETTLSMKSLDGAVAVINNPKHASRTIMVITKNLDDAEYLCRQTNSVIKNVLIGGLRSGEGKKQVDLNSYLNDSDMSDLESMNQLGVSITMQADPTSRKLTYSDIIKIYNK